MKKNQQGFFHLYYLLILIAVIAVGLIGWKVVSQNKNKSINSQAAANCSPPGTPTCDMNGHPISAQANQAGAQTQTLNVPYTNIKLSGTGPQGLDIDQQTGDVYVANNGVTEGACQGGTPPSTDPNNRPPGTDTMSIVNLNSMKEISQTPVVDGPVWPFVDTQRGVVYVGGSGLGQVGVYNSKTGQQETVINTGGRPHAFGLHGSILIVSNTGDNTETHMSVINADTRQVISTQSSPALPHGIVYDSVKNVFYMVGVKTGAVAIINADTGVIESTFDDLSGTGNSNMLAFSTKTRKLFIADSQASSDITVVNVDTRQKAGTINLSGTGSAVWGMQVDDGSGLLYAAMPDADAVGVADVNSLKALGMIKVDSCPYAVRLDTSLGLGVSTGQIHSTLSVFKLADVKKALGR